MWFHLPMRKTNFYPRPPRGGRHVYLAYKYRFATISIHALREEGDTATAPRTRRSWYFYPRPPRGGRRFCRCAYRGGN